MNATRYWVRWYEYCPDNRPVTDPPAESILAWWETGRGNDYSTICAVIEATNEDEAKELVSSNWPDDGSWKPKRFDTTDDRGPTFDASGLSDRFPVKDWMVERLRVKETP